MNTTKNELTTEQNDTIYEVFIGLCNSGYSSISNLAVKLIPLMSNQKINHIDDHGKTALYYACKNGLSDVIDKLSKVIDMNIINEQYELIDLMVKKNLIKKFIPNMTNDTKNYTLVLACQYKNTNLAIQLIDELKDQITDYVDNQGKTALYYACLYGLSDVINELVKYLPKQNTSEVLNEILFYWCIPVELCQIINNYFVDYLTENNIISAFDNYNKNSELQYGLLNYWDISNVSMLKLLDKKPYESLLLHIIHKIPKKQYDYVDESGNTIIINSIKNGYQHVANYLVLKLPKKIINQVDYQKKTALHYASSYYRLSEVSLALIPIMSIDAINQVDTNKRTALHYACHHGLSEVALALIPIMSNDAINYVDSYKDTALIWACYNKLSVVALELIPIMSKYAINHVDKYKRTALDHAKQNNMFVVIQAIESRI